MQPGDDLNEYWMEDMASRTRPTVESPEEPSETFSDWLGELRGPVIWLLISIVVMCLMVGLTW